MAMTVPLNYEPQLERHFMLRENDVRRLVSMRNRWLKQAELFRKLHGKEDAAAATMELLAQDLHDWITGFGMPFTGDLIHAES